MLVRVSKSVISPATCNQRRHQQTSVGEVRHRPPARIPPDDRVTGRDAFERPVGVVPAPISPPFPAPLLKIRGCFASGMVIGCLIPNRRHKLDVGESVPRRRVPAVFLSADAPPGLSHHQLERAPPPLGGWHTVPSRPSRSARRSSCHPRRRPRRRFPRRRPGGRFFPKPPTIKNVSGRS